MIKNSLAKSYAIAVDFPSGAILPFGGTISPAGWLLCNGDSLLISQYPSLFAAIGKAWGSADSTHFNIPDLRGRFLRGVDGGIARDPDRASRASDKTGGNSGDNVGSVQGMASAKVSDTQIINGQATKSTTGLANSSSSVTGNSTSGAASIGNASQDHTHSGTSSGQSQSHTHSGTSGNQSQGHTHAVSGSTATDGPHSHSYVMYGSTYYANMDLAFTSGSNKHGPSAQGSPTSDTLNATSTGSSHSHSISLTSGGASQDHTHSFTSGNASQDHTHTLTTGTQSQSHNHTDSGHTHGSAYTASAQTISGDNETRPVNANVNYIIKI